MLNPQYTVQYFSDVCKHKTEICEVWWIASSYQKKKSKSRDMDLERAEIT